MITSVFLNLVYLFFPILCYFIYLIYSKVTYEKENKLFFALSLFSSYYLCSRFGDKNLTLLLLINIPLILSFCKRSFVTSLGLSICISFLISNTYDINILLLMTQYMLILLFSYLTNYNILKTFMFFEGIFIIIVMFIGKGKIFSLKLFVCTLLFLMLMYIILKIIMSLYSGMKKIVDMYHSLEDITKEKTLYQSLFKITHEIKNPLAVCKGYLDMFDIKNPSKANKYISIINQEIDRTLVLLKDFSDVSKIKVERNFMDINMLLEDVCDEAKLIFKNNTNFKYILNENEIIIYGDYNRLKQVLVNVIKNAKEAISDHGEVILKTKCNKNEFVIMVKDNGIGMDKETKNQIGTPFYTTKKNGTGLGVCFSKEIVEMHGGTMKYYSKEQKGTQVKITLPLKSTSSC